MDADTINNMEDQRGLGERHKQAILMFFCLAAAYSVRTSMSVAVVAMSDRNNSMSEAEIYDWTKIQQDYVLASFFWGYMLMQIPAGYLAYNYGGKFFLCISLFCNGVLSLLIPHAASCSWKVVCACRVLQGLTQSFFIPSLHTLIGKWALIKERNRFGNFVYAGSYMGTLLGTSTSGYLAATEYGWPIIFYTAGIVCIICGVTWFYFGADSPTSHKKISSIERSLIVKSIGINESEMHQKIPWKDILTSIPMLALAVAHITAVWGFLMMLTETPSFIKMALGYNIIQSGLMTGIPYALAWAISLTSSSLADYFVNKKIFSVSKVRKLANTIGTWGPAFAMIILTFVPANFSILALTLVMLAICLDSVNCSGFLMNPIDLSPRFAGTLIGITNFLAIVVGNFAPITAGLIINNPENIADWRCLFFLTSGVYIFGNLFFIIFGTTERQPWDSFKSENKL